MKIALAAVTAMAMAGAALGAFGGVKINAAGETGRVADDIKLPFVDDPRVIGEWTSVDIVGEPGQFVPGARRFRGELFLKGIVFRANGWMTGLSQTWTRGVILDGADRTASRYEIRELGGAEYMFLEWKSGDYTIRHMKPALYVLKKK